MSIWAPGASPSSCIPLRAAGSDPLVLVSDMEARHLLGVMDAAATAALPVAEDALAADYPHPVHEGLDPDALRDGLGLERPEDVGEDQRK